MARLRILVAEDHNAMRKCIVNILSADFEVIAAVPDGEELVASALKLKPDVIVTDIRMPRLDGVSALLRLRDAGVFTPAVLVTVDEDLVAHVNLRSACCISKSEMYWKLNAAVRQAAAQVECKFAEMPILEIAV